MIYTHLPPSACKGLVICAGEWHGIHVVLGFMRHVDLG